MHVVLIDDNMDLLAAMTEAYELADVAVQPFSSAEKALKTINAAMTGVIVTDVRMPDMDGLELYKKVQKIDPKIPVILITGHADVPMVLSMLKVGVFDFLAKPLNIEELTAASMRAIETRRLVLENRELKQLSAKAAQDEMLIGESPAIRQLRDIVEQVARANVDVLIEGETGTERNIVAKLLHRLSPQSRNGFEKINCSALTDEVGPSELFGRAVGTGPYNRHAKVGRIEASNRGMLFFDKIDSLSNGLQGQLLSVVENREIVPIGGQNSKKLNLRIVASCKPNLSESVARGTFSSDLYYRLNTVRLSIPPLRERREDIPLLFAHFLMAAAEELNRKVPRVKAETRKFLYTHAWPGNIRELRNYAQSIALGIERPSQTTGDVGVSLKERVQAFEAATIKSALINADGQVGRAIESLQVPRKTFYDKVSRYDIDVKKYRKTGEDSQ